MPTEETSFAARRARWQAQLLLRSEAPLACDNVAANQLQSGELVARTREQKDARMKITTPRRMLVIGDSNAGRSQMIEAYVNAVAGGRWRAVSAGAAPNERVASLTVLALAKAGLGEPTSTRSIAQVMDRSVARFDVVITVSEDAAALATQLSRRGILTLHWPLPDPTTGAGVLEDRLETYRAVLDAVRSKVDDFLAEADSAVAA